MQPSRDWLELWRQNHHKTHSLIDFEAYFSLPVIAGKQLGVMELGQLSVPTGALIACDPLYSLNRSTGEYFLTAPQGLFTVETAVVKPDLYNEACFAALRVLFSDSPVSYYAEALTGRENLSDFEAGQFFGLNIKSGLVCICDIAARNAAIDFITLWYDEHPNENIYDSYFVRLFRQNAEKHPLYQPETGCWLNWRVPGTNMCVPLCRSGFGDGVYPVYFGFNRRNEICQLVVHFIDIEMAFTSYNAV